MASHSGIEQGVVDILREYFADTQGRYIGAAPPNGQPPPAFGQWYIGVSEATCQRGPSQSGDVRDQVYTLLIGVTFRSSVTPYDRLGWMTNNPARNDRSFGQQGVNAAEFPNLSINAVADTVAGLIEERYEPINAANTHLDSRWDGFVEPFHYVNIGPVTDKPGGWVFSDMKLRPGEISFIQITASGARRIRIKGAIDNEE